MKQLSLTLSGALRVPVQKKKKKKTKWYGWMYVIPYFRRILSVLSVSALLAVRSKRALWAWRDGHLHLAWLQKELHDLTLLLRTLSSELPWRKAARGGQSSSRGSERPKVTWTLRQIFWKPKGLSFNKTSVSQTFWRWSTRYEYLAPSPTEAVWNQLFLQLCFVWYWFDWLKKGKRYQSCCCIQTLIPVDFPPSQQLSEAVSVLEQDKEAAELSRFEESRRRGELHDKWVMQCLHYEWNPYMM